MATVHATATVRGAPQESQARCGWTYVQTTADPSRVTCKSCLRLYEAGRTAESRIRAPSAEQVHTGLRAALLQVAGVPTAPPPPQFDPSTWQTLCRPDPEVQERCGSCDLCEYERELVRFAALDPYRVVYRDLADPDSPVFGSLNGALVALAWWQINDRHDSSKLGAILDKVRIGQVGGRDVGALPANKLLDRAEDISHVAQAVKHAYEGDNAAYLPPEHAEALLLIRTPGVIRGQMPTYVEIAERLLQADYVATPRQLKRVVRHGRRYVSVELAARGLIRDPASNAGLAEAIERRRIELGVREAA